MSPVTSASGDPLPQGLTLSEATRGLAKEGGLLAELRTTLGKLECELFETRAPRTVANFVGLARGLRPSRSAAGTWQQKPAYDGTIFFRIVKGAVLQGGDPLGNGTGAPGYVLPTESWPGALHDRRGLLCMTNRGPLSNGMQFLITDGPLPELDGGFTIFGQCGPTAVLDALANVESYEERAVYPPKLEKVTIRRVARVP